jgi:hypothetical protein
MVQQKDKENVKASIIRPKEQKSGQTIDSSKKNTENKCGKKNGTTK